MFQVLVKSTLVNEVLYKSLAKQINKSKVKPGEYDEINGIDQLDRIIDIDQSPIGRTPRSNPATYTGVLIILEIYLHKQMNLKSEVIPKVVLVLMLKAVAVKHVKAMVSLKLKCTFTRCLRTV